MRRVDLLSFLGTLSRHLVLPYLAFFISAAPARATPYQMSYTGRLTDGASAPIPGPVDLDIAFFHELSGGDPVAVEPLSFPGTKLKDGIFQLSLDLAPADFGTIFGSGNDPVYIQVTDRTHSRSYPRQLLSAVPYALRVPVDDKTLSYGGDGKLKVALPGAAAVGQFLTSDASGNWQWAIPASGTLSTLAVHGTAGTVATNTAGTTLSFSNTGANSVVSAGSLSLGVTAAPTALQVQAGNTKTVVNVAGDKVGIGTTATPGSALEIRGSGTTGATSGLNVTNSAGTSSLFIQDDGKVGIGTTVPTYQLHVSSTNQAVSEGIDSAYKLATGDSIGLRAFNKQTTLTNTGNIFGVRAFAYGGNAGEAISTQGLFGVSGEAQYRGSATQALMVGAQGTVANSSTGTVTDAISLRARAPTNTSTGAVTNAYSLYIETPTAGATSNYALYSPGGTDYFGGAVGIGTTTPVTLLEIAGGTGMGQATVRGALGGEVCVQEGAGSFSGECSTGAKLQYDGTGNTFHILTTNGNSWTGKERLSIARDSGNVGIGTTGPGARLEVDAPTTSTTGLIVKTTDDNLTKNLTEWRSSTGTPISYITGNGTLVVGTPGATNALTVNGPAVGSYADSYATAIFNGAAGSEAIIKFKSQSANANGTHFNLTGDDGSSAGKLLFDFGYGNPGMVFKDQQMGVGNVASIVGSNYSLSSALDVYSKAATTMGLMVRGAASQTANLQEWQSSTGVPLAAVDAAGAFGIGNAAPSYPLDVVGDINTTTCVRIAGTGQLGSCPSDERFKRNIEPITGALGRLSLLRPVHYEFRTAEFPEYHFSRELEVGLIAQELERVFPDLVTTGDDGYKRVKYGLELEMQTIAAVKELKSEKDALAGKVAELEAGSRRLEEENRALKAKLQAVSAYLCAKDAASELCTE